MVSQPHIVFLTETWLSNKIPSSLIIGALPYTILRFDRSSRGGGVAIIIRDYLSYSTVTLPSSEHEITCIDLFHQSAYIRLCVVYRPPTYSLSKSESLITCLSDIHASSPHPIVIIGDFNSDSLCTHPTPIDRLFLDFQISVDLTHCHMFPTRGNRCIDWIIANDPSLIPTISIVPPFPSCDHSGLSFSLSSPQSPSLPSQIRDFTRVDYSAFFNYLLSVDWFSLFCDCPDIDSIYSAFSSAIHSAIDLFVPYRTPRPPSLSYPPHIRRLIKHRDALFSKVHLPSVRILFDQCSKKLLFEIDKWTRYSTRKKLSRVNDLYRHISSLTKPKLSIPELVSPQNLPVFDSISKSNLLASEFASHFTLDDGCLPSLSSSRVPPSLSLFTFFPHEVYKSLRKLSPTCSTGHDAIPQIIFSKCAYALITKEFQSALNCVFDWTQCNQLSLSASKCSHIRIGSKQASPWYSINSTVLPLENNVRDLGAQVRSDLKNSSSIKMRAQKATSKMFLLLKALPFNCPSILILTKPMFFHYLASPFWNPHYSSDIATLEKVQHTFTRQLFYRCFPSPDYPLSLPSYSDRIKTFGLRALTERSVIDRTSSFGINIELTTSTPRYHSFPVRISRWYSQLPDSIRTAPNIRMFKRRLENHPIIAHLAKLT
uniref:Endonuclease/exonuclease/phosphatase domain-containing protein n=1 Tax=Pristionchus pacificus TaxID=54126 RepID=A0A8R1YP87_PRIPA